MKQEEIILFSAHYGDPKEPIAMSLCIRQKDMLWGRYWGSEEEIDNLHFEVCYYSPISWALKNGISQFDPGAGGSHKQRRGFINQSTVSMHRWYDKNFDSYIRYCLPKVNKLIIDEIESKNKQLPFKVIES